MVVHVFYMILISQHAVSIILSTVKAAFMLVPDYKSGWAPMVGIESIVVTRSWLDSLPGATDLECNRNPGSAAFVVCTSGSTGTLKGFVIDQCISFEHPCSWSLLKSHQPNTYAAVRLSCVRSLYI